MELRQNLKGKTVFLLVFVSISSPDSSPRVRIAESIFVGGSPLTFAP